LEHFTINVNWTVEWKVECTYSRRMRKFWALLKKTGVRWIDHNTPRLGAALAYYTVLSMAPLLVVAIGIAGLVFGEKAARGEIVTQVSDLVGGEIGKIVQDLLKSAHQQDHGVAASVFGGLTLLIGASAVFGELRDSLNLIWNHNYDSSGWKGFLRYRLFTFAVVMAVGFLLLVSLVVNTMLAFLSTYVGSRLPIPPAIAMVMDTLISVFVTALLFALIYKYIPDVPVKWRDVQIGAVFTAILFSIGKLLIGLYLGKASVGSAYGAAGSLVVLLVWVYYSSQVFFFGAEFTKVYSERYDPPPASGTGIAS